MGFLAVVGLAAALYGTMLRLVGLVSWEAAWLAAAYAAGVAAAAKARGATRAAAAAAAGALMVTLLEMLGWLLTNSDGFSAMLARLGAAALLPLAVGPLASAAVAAGVSVLLRLVTR